MPGQSKKKLRIWEPLVIGISAAIGLLAGYSMNFSNANDSLLAVTSNDGKQSYTQKDGRIEEILRFVETKYVDSIDAETITLQLIEELLDQLDPHSSYISQEELSDHNERMKGEYIGIGIESLVFQDTFYITKVIDGGPAQKAGLVVGDAIIKINDAAVSGAGKKMAEVQAMLKDENGEAAFNIVLLPVGASDVKSIELKSKSIVVSSANVCYMLDEKTAYLKLARFSANTYEQFIEAIESIKKGRTELNLVLDLRDNPGGYLPEAIKILSQLFVEKDKLLTYTEGLNRKRRDYRTTGNAFYNINKLAVLVDEYSASGSEILAGAIQDWDRGLVIGGQSYGKGLVQELFPMKNGGALRLTVAKYYTPSGRLIQKSYNSESNNFAADSSSHLTKVLEREKGSGNGIEPDVVLVKEDCFDFQYYFDQFILHTMKAKGTIELSMGDFSKSDYFSFVAETYKEDISGSNANCIDGFNKAIYLRYKQMLLPELEYVRYANLSDGYIKEALDFINDERSTLVLLADEK